MGPGLVRLPSRRGSQVSQQGRRVVAQRDERGIGLVELAVAMAITAILISVVASSMMVVSGQTSSLSRQTQAIDELQTAEQTIVREIHAAVTWCSTPTTSQLSFSADLPGTASPVFDLNLSSGELTVATATSCPPGGTWSASSTLASGLSSASAFSIPPGASWTGTVTGNSYSFWTSVGVTLTIDTPAPGGVGSVKTTVADPSVQVWNQLYTCQKAWQQDPGNGVEPC